MTLSKSAQEMAKDEMSEGLKDTLYELGSQIPPFDPNGDYIRCFRGTTEEDLYLEDEVWGDGELLHFDFQKEEAEDYAILNADHPLSNRTNQKTPFLVMLDCPVDKIGKTVGNSDSKSYRSNEFDEGKLHMDVSSGSMAGYGLPSEWIETERI
ncbi:MAG: hypothetical protein V5A72_00085 [Candidatus Nanohaloarchaea archaeon]